MKRLARLQRLPADSRLFPRFSPPGATIAPGFLLMPRFCRAAA
jgi:hypothetical protein